jgi:hypothetical protein
MKRPKPTQPNLAPAPVTPAKVAEIQKSVGGKGAPIIPVVPK